MSTHPAKTEPAALAAVPSAPAGAPVEAKPASKARQGVTSGRVMTILVAGLVLVVAGFVASFILAV